MSDCGHPNHGGVDHDCRPFVRQRAILDERAAEHVQSANCWCKPTVEYVPPRPPIRSTKVGIETRVCPECKDSFTTNRIDRHYCSDDCRNGNPVPPAAYPLDPEPYWDGEQ